MLVAMVFASSALASSHNPTGEYAQFKECPLNRATITDCVYAVTDGGGFTIGKKTVPLVNPVTLPFVFMEELKRLGIRMIPLNHQDPSWAINCLAVAPGRVLMSDKVGPRTQDALDKAVKELAEKYPKPDVARYFWALLWQDPGTWAGLKGRPELALE